MIRHKNWLESISSPMAYGHLLLLFSTFSVLTSEPIQDSDVESDVGAMLYLQRFGYMNESTAANLISEETYHDAIKDFQRFAGLNETGLLDGETAGLMNSPRCGNKDHVGHAEDAKRRKRYALQGSKWRRTELTYRISKYPRKIKKSVADREIARAFKVWSDVTPLNFIAKKDGRVHIDIRFVVGEHGDGDPFDGPGNTLAHAYFPQYGGDAHFDDEEVWSINSYSGTNLFQVAAHELGHSLGLGHSSVRTSLMAPFYQRYQPNFKLNRDDVLGIQSLYGQRVDPQNDPKPRPTEKPLEPDTTGDAPDLCQDGRIDSATRIADGSTYVFKGNHYWKVETNGLADGYPRRISTDWDGLPGSVDAALTWADGKTFFFKGDKYWKFMNQKMASGYPKQISVGFAGIPNNIDAAFVWSGNGKTYFFKGNQYWRFDSKNDPPVGSRYPKPIKNWVGLPNNIDAAFKWENGLTYFFKGRDYFRFNDADFEVDTKAKPPFPRQTSVWWFDCKSAQNSPRRKGGLVAGIQKKVFVGSVDNEMTAVDTSVPAEDTLDASESANSAHVVEVDKDDHEWMIHGQVDEDDISSPSASTS